MNDEPNVSGASDPVYVDPVIEAYKKDVDRSMLRENLRLSVEQRLVNLMAAQRFALEIRRAMSKAKGNG